MGNPQHSNSGSASGRKKNKKKVYECIVHVYASFNNTIITFTDSKGNALGQQSAGKNNFKGSRKGTPFAGQVAAEKAAAEMKENLGTKAVEIRVSGPGSGKESAIRALHASGLKVTKITDCTSIPHNGCRPPKERRV